MSCLGSHLHSIGVHGLAGVELPVLEGGNDLLGKGLGLGLEVLDFLIGLARVNEVLLDGLHVACDWWISTLAHCCPVD